MSKYDECLRILLTEAEKKGYLTFDSIIDTTDSFDLILSDVDRVSEAIHLRSIIVYETDPAEQCEDNLEDYSRIDYNQIFEEIVKIAPELNYIINIIKEISPPQYKEITLLVTQNAEGNKYARERLILSHLRVVLKIALSMSKQHELDLTEAVSSGFLGLIVATDKFDPNGFSAFQSYASMRIQQHIQRECNPIWFEFYYPEHYKTTMINIKERYESLYGSICDGMLKKDMNDFSIKFSEEFQMQPLQILTCLQRIKNQKLGHFYLDELIDSDEINKFYSYIVYKGESPENYTNEKMLKEEIFNTLAKLKEREKKVILLRFGLLDGQPRTLEQVGNIFNVTRERIRQIESKALRRLKAPSRCKSFEDYRN